MLPTALLLLLAAAPSSQPLVQVDGKLDEPRWTLKERIEKRLRRYKRRLKDHAAGANGAVPEAMDIPSYVIQAPDHDEDTGDGEFHPIVIAETKKAMKTLSVSEAVQDLDLTGAPLVTFRHAGSGRVNIVYRRSDGNIGWIDPPTLAGDTQ